MPIRLEPRDVAAELETFKSVLVVSCPICPAVSLAITSKKPLISLFKHGLKTQAFEDYVTSIRRPLEQCGIRTDTFIMRLPHPLMCLWTDGQRRRLLKRAREYEAVLVLGCHSATHTARLALKDAGCQVFQGMRELGLTNATVRVRYPITVELDTHPMPGKFGTPPPREGAVGAKEFDAVAS
jgi:hypothetical protein